MSLASALRRLLLPGPPKGRPKELLLGMEKRHLAGTREVSVYNGRGVSRIRAPFDAGVNGPFKVRLENEPNQHVMLVGHTGSGKSTAMKAFLSRAFLNYGIPFLIIDWSGSYGSLRETVNLWSVPRELRINPFALRGMDAGRRAGVASETLMHALDLTPLQTQKVRETLAKLYDRNPEPQLSSLYDALREQSGDRNFMKMQFTHIANKLRQAGGVFGYEPAEFWSGYQRGCNVVELDGLTDAEKKLVTYALLQRITEEFTSETSTRLYIALDDAYQALKSAYTNESPISKIVREGRKYGFGLVIATQLLSDLPQAVLANTALKLIFSYQESLGARDIAGMLNLSYEEKDLMRRMPPGWCLVLDQHRASSEEHAPSYVNITGLSGEEMAELSSKANRIDIKEITEERGIVLNAAAKTEMLRKLDIPSVSVYRFLIALRDARSAKEAYKLLRKRGWLTSLTTIYGTKSKPSILARAKSSGYVDEGDVLNEKAMHILDSKLMVEAQGVRAGSEEHKSLMEKTIRLIQERGNFAFVPIGKDDFDVGEVPAHADTKGAWDFEKLKIYEIQCNALNEEVEKGAGKARRMGAPLVWISRDANVLEEIRKQTGDGDSYMQIS
ncbi:MAG: DUF87 domain-containing protein [Candidatus Micrarchaeales archaeon]|nr:DUF87 domain-containing protein [Candidatus Micrarchaeales archaeon]